MNWRDRLLPRFWSIKDKDSVNCVPEMPTGLKDKNGKLIYKGDILGGIFENLYVHYCDVCKQFELKSNEYGCMACSGDLSWWEIVEAKDLEVVGNIHENPELLGEE